MKSAWSTASLPNEVLPATWVRVCTPDLCFVLLNQRSVPGALLGQSLCILWFRVLALPPERKGLSRLWVPLFGMFSPLTSVLCLGTFPVLFINSSRLSSLSGPGLGAPLSSYLEGALYKLIYIYIDR